MAEWALAALAILVVAAWVARPAPAPAIASATPADGSALARAPTSVDLSFTGLLDPVRSHVWVLDSSGASVAAARPATVDAGRINQPVTIIAPSAVTVTYHVTFLDGTQIEGALSFTVGPAGGAAAPPAAAGHPHGVDPFSAALLAVDGFVVLVVAVLLVRRPRRL